MAGAIKLVQAAIIAFIPSCVFAQAVRPGPYSAQPGPYSGQLKSDPDVGNVQGIQRYGRPLRTDPDQGEGYSYHVYPVAHQDVPSPRGTVSPGAGTASPGVSFRQGAVPGVGMTLRNAIVEMQGGDAGKLDADIKRVAEEIKALKQELAAAPANQDNSDLKDAVDAKELELRQLLTKKALAEVVQAAATRETELASAPVDDGRTVAGSGSAVGLYPPSFDWTEGLRNPTLGQQVDTPHAGPASANRAAAVNRGRDGTTAELQIYHQPLIQIRMRVVEVARTDGLAVNSVLEYVSQGPNKNSLTSGNSANNGKENLRGISRFDIADLVQNATTGTGALVNLTSRHINWLLQMLATERNADVITAPEMVTLNGQNVEFVAGEKLPFALGQNVIQGTNNNIQQVFYKHVGTMVSVTPRIVNWGLHGEGEGRAVIVASDVNDWNKLIASLLALREAGHIEIDSAPANGAPSLLSLLNTHQNRAVPYSLQGEILMFLNRYPPEKFDVQGVLRRMGSIGDSACGNCKNWKPEDCTIDLSVVVRLSEGAKVQATPDDTALTEVTTGESNVRAVANVIQVKSGHGVVMAGLIGEREIEDAAKVPILGDIPVVGFFFRSKAVTRVKTEVLVFVEAQVLDPTPEIARAESSHDFQLAGPYVEGEFLENPLEYGLYRVGFGSYLPPHTHGERMFWERFGRRVRKQHTHIYDALK